MNKTLFITCYSLTLFLSFQLGIRAQDIQPYKAQEIKPYKAQDVKTEKAHDIQTYKTEEVKQNKAQDVKNQKEIQQTQEIVKTKSSDAQSATKKIQNQPNPTSMDSYFGLYQYWVPGASYTTPDYSNHQLVVHNSAGTGVLPGGISISRDNKFVWNSNWDGKIIKGTWRQTNDSGYPIEIVGGQENKSWKIGKAPDKSADIVIWDGSTWYYGKKLK